MSYFEDVSIADGPINDAFGRIRVSNPTTIFESSFLYDLQPLIYEPRTATGGTVTHDSTNSAAILTVTSTAGSLAQMSSFRWVRYQPGKSQLAKITFNMNAITNASNKFIGLYDDVSDNGIIFQRITTAGGATTNQIVLRSSTTPGIETAVQSAWSLDKLDGTGPSGITLDTTKTQILVIDMQWLGVGRVRVGFAIDGMTVYAHEFLNANKKTNAYMKWATLPVLCTAVTTAGASTGSTMQFICAAIESEGGIADQFGYSFTSNTSITAGNLTRTAALSIRPRTTFNSITNRQQLDFLDLSFLVTGTNPVLWELCIGSTFTAAPTWANVDTTYSSMEYTTAPGTLNTAGIVIASGLLAAGSAASGSTSFTRQFLNLYPLTLDRAGAQRANGTLTLLMTGLGGTSAARACMNWKEIR